MKKLLKILSLTFPIFMIFYVSCEKDIEIKPPSKLSDKIILQVNSVSNISCTSAFVTSSITDIGNKKIIQHGHCYGIDSFPDTSGYITKLGNLENDSIFSSNLTGLVHNTKYFV